MAEMCLCNGMCGAHECCEGSADGSTCASCYWSEIRLGTLGGRWQPIKSQNEVAYGTGGTSVSASPGLANGR